MDKTQVKELHTATKLVVIVTGSAECRSLLYHIIDTVTLLWWANSWLAAPKHKAGRKTLMTQTFAALLFSLHRHDAGQRQWERHY
jgi:hypothetical protein